MILLYGPAGSGKSTQGKILAAKYGWKYISAGELLRQKATTDENLKSIMNSGNIVPASIVNEVVFDAVDPVGGSHIVVDGYPRELGEATDLVDRYGASMIASIIVIELSESESIKRLQLRGREDDDTAAIKRRLEIYHEEMKPILNFFDEHNVRIIKVDGTPDIATVTEGIERELIKWQIL
jgi:adenylate kinase